MTAAQVHYSSTFNYEDFRPYSIVLAFDDDNNSWQTTSLAEVEDCPERFPRFFMLEDIVPVEPETPSEKVKKKVDELIGWIGKWSVRSDAVDEVLNDYRQQIFELLDEVPVA